jgi:hypothetical protein
MVTQRRPVQRTVRARRATKAAKPFDGLAYLLKMSERIPPEELAKMPRDLAYNFDHYHDGSPKQL